jgi:hypothetical protein
VERGWFLGEKSEVSFVGRFVSGWVGGLRVVLGWSAKKIFAHFGSLHGSLALRRLLEHLGSFISNSTCAREACCLRNWVSILERLVLGWLLSWGGRFGLFGFGLVVFRNRRSKYITQGIQGPWQSEFLDSQPAGA